MGYWSDGVMLSIMLILLLLLIIVSPITPLLHYSTTPIPYAESRC
jgi:hypothetical protein